MALLNYTTTISVGRTLGEIQETLVRHGARKVLVDYDDHANPIALEFLVRTPYGERGFRLPARVDAVWKTLVKQKDAGQIRRAITRDQANRVAWRILKDWVDAQMALIESQMVVLEEVMLPYMLTESGEQTVYERLVAGRLQLALPPGREASRE